MSPAPPRTTDAVILLPGVMGSALSDADGKPVWGFKPRLLFRQLVHGDVLSRLKLPPDGGDDGIRASGLVRFPSYLPLLGGVDSYSGLSKRLKGVVLRPDAFLEFGYDWRRSIADAARALEPVAAEHLDRWKQAYSKLPGRDPRAPEPMLTLVGHSMGGLVARYFADVLGGRDIVRRIVTLGTPFNGALNAVRVLATGEYLPLGVLAGSLRDAVRTFPGAYELVARYECVVESRRLVRLTPGHLKAIGADLDMAAAAFAVHENVAQAVAEAGAQACEVRPLVGVTQPTLQSVSISAGEARFSVDLDGTDWRGDGTVYRNAAYVSGSVPGYLPQRHGKLAQTNEAIVFVESALTERALGLAQADVGIGMTVPDSAKAGEPCEITVEAERPTGVTCRVTDAETNRQVAMAVPRRRADRLVAEVTIPRPGLYRVSATGGGFSPVEEMLLVLE